MVKYVILADSKNNGFETPRQLTKINGEPLVKRTIRLLKENGVKDIIITSHDKRFDNLGATRYEPLYNYYEPNYNDYTLNKGYWLNAFPVEFLKEPVTFLFGDVYYSENAIKTIVETQTDSTLFFCTYENKNKFYIKKHDEPLAYKVVDYELFKKHIEIVKDMKDKGLCCREPIVWELYRSINRQDINVHTMTKNYMAINDESCDIDCINDVTLLEKKLGGIQMIKCEVIANFTLKRFDELENVKRKRESGNLLEVGDTFEAEEELVKYLTGGNSLGKVVVKVIEILPKEEPKIIEKITTPVGTFGYGPVEIKETKPKKKKTSKK